MDELKHLLIQYGYVKDIPNLPKQLTGNRRMANFLKLVVEELKSCDSLTGDTRQRFDELRKLSRELNPREFQKVLEERQQQKSNYLEQSKLEAVKLEEQARPLREQLQTLNHIHKKLSYQYEQSLQEKETLTAHLTQCQREHDQSLNDTKVENTKVNQGLVSLQDAVTSLSDLYTEQLTLKDQDESHPTKETTKPLFLSSLSQKPYHKAEEKFTKELTSYVKNQFLPGMMTMVGSSDAAQYGIINQTQLLEHLSQEDYQKHSEELKRLQEVYSLCESKSIAHEVSAVYMKASRKRLEEEIEGIKSGREPLDIETIRQQIKAKEEQVAELKINLDGLTTNTLPVQIQDLTTSKISRVLHGNCDLKLARQQYYLSKQDKIISQLEGQRGRQELFSMLLEVELRYHRDTHRLLLAALSQLEKWTSETSERQKQINDLVGNQPPAPQLHINPIDRTGTNLCQLLCLNGTPSRPLVTWEELDSAISHVSQSVSVTEAELKTQQEELESMIEKMDLKLKELECYVFGESKEKRTVQFVPVVLKENKEKLQTLLTSLEQGIKTILKEYEGKRKLLQTSPLLEAEKNLFVHFFTNPQKLSKLMVDLTHRVNTLAMATTTTTD